MLASKKEMTDRKKPGIYCIAQLNAASDPGAMTIASNYAVAEEVVPLFLGDLRSSESNRLEIGKLDVDMLIFDISLWALQHVKVRSASLHNQELAVQKWHC